MHGTEFFRRHHALAIRSDIQALLVKIIPLPLRLAYLRSIRTSTWQLLRRATDDGVGILRLAW